jgi:UrcA family protein
MKTAILSLVGICTAVPALAEAQTVYVVKYGEEARITVTARPTLAEQIENAAETVCVRPDIRDLKSWSLYEACLADVRAQITEKIAALETDEVELAVR